MKANVGGNVFDEAALRAQINARLDALVPADSAPARAARHSLLAAGKRLRALLTIAATARAGGDPALAMDAACAVEMVHTASLIFDDLPAMDDAPLRRGVPTPHVLFGEGVAILAGIGLMNAAFEAAAQCPGVPAARRLSVVELLTTAIGWTGLVGGQALDLNPDGASVDVIHHGKTGVLFVAAADIGAVIAGLGPEQRAPFVQFGRALGGAYQALDDILDHLGKAETAGKPTQRDGGKLSGVSPASLAAARARATRALADADAALGGPAGDPNCPMRGLMARIERHFQELTSA